MDMSHWSEKLPLVVVGIRSVLQGNLHCTTAELIYGTTLDLPGEFFDSTSRTNTPDPASYVAQLKASMQQLWGSPAKKQPLQNIPNWNLYEATPYDDTLPTGCERCVYVMAMRSQPTTLITINPE